MLFNEPVINMEIVVWVLAFLLSVAAAFDAISTLQAFKRNAVEANGFMAWMQRKLPNAWPYVKFSIFGLLPAALILVAFYNGSAVGATLAGIAGVAGLGYVIWNNYGIAWRK